jgi:Fe-S cluster assembly ATP-binding protein
MKTRKLEIKDLEAETAEGKKILNGINLVINSGEINVIMGPNGGGKSTLALVLMGHPGYRITRGKIMIGNKDVSAMSVEQRAKEGLFLAFQYPVEVAGVNFAGFLRMASPDKSLSPLGFRKELEIQAKKLAFGEDMSKRSLNEGFSGGEKKKGEILQMVMLKPKYAILDEPDSGLDVDALKYIAEGVNRVKDKTGILLITHYQRILKYIIPDRVHILIKGKIVKSGGAELARQVEEEGYEKYQR